MGAIDRVVRRMLTDTTQAVLSAITGNVSDLITVKTDFVPAVLNKVFLRATFPAGLGLIIIFNSHLIFAKANKARYVVSQRHSKMTNTIENVGEFLTFTSSDRINTAIDTEAFTNS